MSQEGKIALVTGGSRGIGKAIVHAFLEQGFTVIFAGTTKETVASAMNEFSAYKEKAIGKACDVTQSEQVNALAEDVKVHGKLNVLVNNAGVFVPDTFAEGDASDLRKLMEINVFGTYAVSQAVLPLLLKTKQSHIFNTCSIAGQKAYPNGCSYSVSKFAMDGLGKSMRLELMDKGVRVTNVYPGATYTDSWASSDLPKSRFMQADDIAKSILNAYNINEFSDVEEIVIRPILGDI